MPVTNARPPTLAEVVRITSLDDPIVRNLQITQAYHELAVGLASWLPGANWCSVATWASRQAGQSIRREDLRMTLRRLVRESREAQEAAEALQAEGALVREEGIESLAGAIDALRDALNPAAAFERTADAVARGNRKVFGEIGLEFARFLALFATEPPDPAAMSAFIASLQPGEPPDGQRLLRQAFSHYYTALAEQHARTRAELVLLANLEIGLHEQTRLQPEIQEAMDAPVYDPGTLRRRLLDELFPDPAAQLRLAALRLMGQAGPLLAARDRLAHEAQRLGRLAITQVMMTLELSGGRVLHLGDELRATVPDILSAPSQAELVALLRQLEPALGQSRVAVDWSELPARMRFITDLFRGYHIDPGLFDPPFTPAQTAALKAGRRPADI